MGSGLGWSAPQTGTSQRRSFCEPRGRETLLTWCSPDAQWRASSRQEMSSLSETLTWPSWSRAAKKLGTLEWLVHQAKTRDESLAWSSWSCAAMKQGTQ